jgi:arylsulfatase A-like enzyme
MDRLLDAGYHVGYQGVWEMKHAPGEDRRGEYAHFELGGFPYEDHQRLLAEQGGKPGEQTRPVRTISDDGTVNDWQFSVPVPVVWTDPIEQHQDMQLAASMARFIRDAPRDKPLAAVCAPGAAHPPLVVPRPYADLFNPQDMQPSRSFRSPIGDDSWEPPAVRSSPGRQAVRDFTWEQWSRAIAAYYGYCAFADACVGVVLDALDASGRAEQTTVIVTSDHGELLGAHNLYQKELLYEESARIPLLMAGPDIAPGRRRQLVSHVDVAPTLLAQFGLPAFTTTHGNDLRPIFADPKVPGREQVVMQFNGEIRGGFCTRGIVRDNHKYIYHRDGCEELFDLKHDPDEIRNLANDRNSALLKARLRQALADAMRETRDFVFDDFADFIHTN